MTIQPSLDFHSDPLAHCLACVRLSERGHQIKSYCKGDEFICILSPELKYFSTPGWLRNGKLASTISHKGVGVGASIACRAVRQRGIPITGKLYLRDHVGGGGMSR